MESAIGNFLKNCSLPQHFRRGADLVVSKENFWPWSTCRVELWHTQNISRSREKLIAASRKLLADPALSELIVDYAIGLKIAVS